MLRLVSGADGAAEEPDGIEEQLPPNFRLMLVAFNRTFGADLDALAREVMKRLAALEATVAEQQALIAEGRVIREANRRLIAENRDLIEDLRCRQDADDKRHGVADITHRRLQKQGVLPFLLDRAEERLADGIEPELIAEELGISADELFRQLSIRREWMQRHGVNLRQSGASS